MDPKHLMENWWNAELKHFGVKDNGLGKALGEYEKLDETKYAERLKALELIKKLNIALSNTLKKDKNVGKVADLINYLDLMLDTVEGTKKQIQAAMAKAAADAKKEETQKKQQSAEENAQQKQQAEDEKAQEKEEEMEGAYEARLMKALLILKSSKALTFEFIACDTKPFWGVMVAKKITPKHKEELTKITGGKHFLKPGTCQFDGGHYVFTVEQPVTGMAKRLQDSIKNSTGKKLPITVGKESAEEEEDKGNPQP